MGPVSFSAQICIVFTWLEDIQYFVLFLLLNVALHSLSCRPFTHSSADRITDFLMGFPTEPQQDKRKLTEICTVLQRLTLVIDYVE